MLQLLKKLAHDHDQTVLLSTHDLTLALQLADQLWVITPERDLLVGTPEDLVLQGSFERAFAGEGFSLDRQTGQFQLGQRGLREIFCEGEGLGLLWTERALQRLGFERSLEKTTIYIRVVAVEEGWSWQILGGDRPINCDSIAELLQELEKTIGYNQE
jgi:iron complex transport system ATP-binding protein